MIASREIAQVEALLAQGIAQREVARRLNMGRGTVHAIAHGRVTARDRGMRERARVPRETNLDQRPYERCPGCGGKVKLPCLSCEIKNTAAAPARQRTAKDPVVSAELDGFYERQRRDREQVSRENAAAYQLRQHAKCERCGERHDPLDECPEAEDT